jgi:HTH-type transcriptional regulator/antitoxin HipB
MDQNENAPATRWTTVYTASDLGDFIARLRVENNLTQQELADALGISRRYVYEIESGKPSLYTDRLFSLLRLLGARIRVEAPARAGTGSGKVS